MAILKGEDRTGEIEIPVFPAVFAENEYNLVPGRALLATGICRGRDEHGRLSLILRSCVFLRDNDGYREERSANVPEKPTQKLYLRLSGTNPAIEEKIFNLISIFEGSVPVLLFRNEKNCVPYEKRCAPNPTFLNELALLIGKGNVVLYSPDQREGR